MRQPFVAGNWKMNGTRASIQVLLDGLKAGAESVGSAAIAVCVPFVYLAEVAQELQGTKISWGAQNVSHELKGAFTGEISISMLQDFGCTYVIVGHSERRRYFKEDEKLINNKIKLALKHKLNVILCVGETLEERKQNLTQDIVANQIEWNLKGIKTSELKNIVALSAPMKAPCIENAIKSRIRTNPAHKIMRLTRCCIPASCIIACHLK